MWPQWRRCELSGGGVAQLENVWTCWRRCHCCKLEASKASHHPHYLLLLHQELSAVSDITDSNYEIVIGIRTGLIQRGPSSELVKASSSNGNCSIGVQAYFLLLRCEPLRNLLSFYVSIYSSVMAKITANIYINSVPMSP